MLELQGVSRSFGLRQALQSIDLKVLAGETVVLLGPNGAGKTTLLRIAALLTHPTAGTLRIAGQDPARAGVELRRRIGFLSHRPLLYDELTPDQNLTFYARMYDLPQPAARIAELLQRIGLTHRRNDPVRTLSRGMQQRLAVARAVLHRPPLLLLDEPFTGLDPLAAENLHALLTELAGEGCTLIATLHELDRALDLGRRIIILARGRIVADTPREQLTLDELQTLFAQAAAQPDTHKKK